MMKKRPMSVPPPRKQPMTRADLKGELARYPTKADLKADIQQVQVSVEELRVSSKADLDRNTRALMEGIEGVRRDLTAEIHSVRADLTTEIHNVRTEMRTGFASVRTEVATDVARHANRIIEEITARITVVDDKYADLPERVSRLEARRRR